MIMKFPASFVCPVVWGMCLISSTLLLPACSGDSSPAPGGQGNAAAEAETPGPMPFQRGHLVLGHEVRSFEPCDSQEALWVLDETGGELARVYEELTYEVYQRLYVEILGQEGARPEQGFGADYDKSITVTALRHAAPESLACDSDLSDVVMRASGNEPFWRVDVRQGEILLSELGADDRWFTSSSSSASEAQADGLRQYRGTAGTESGQPASDAIVVTIDEHSCRDSMSGAYFSFVAHVEVDGRELAGCARQGW